MCAFERSEKGMEFFMNIKLNENERIDDLEYKNLKIVQDKDGFCFGIDSVLLSDFAKEIRSKSIVLDLGTGNGVLGILLCGKTNLSKIYGVEIQEDIANIALMLSFQIHHTKKITLD